MKITITKKARVEEKVNLENLKVLRTNSKDIDSTNLEIFYNEIEIGYGHLNNRTNFAHITLDEYNEDLEEYLVCGIENRNISIQYKTNN
tara:strand:+ start:1602 stop:1868 length:267 start_codon:yes stop_codon:yes gene_type:complete